MNDQGALKSDAAISPEAYYQGQRGQAYFARQDEAGPGAVWDLFFWTPYISVSDDIVEFGCGAGHLLSALPGRTKVGVEINPTAAAAAAARGLEVRPSTEGLQSGTFSRAISSHALEHVSSPHSALVELRRLLRPDGELLLLLPLDDWRTRKHRRYEQHDADMHLYTWTPQHLGNLLTSSGFEPLQIDVVTYCWPPRLPQLFWRMSPKIFRAVGHVSARLLKRRQLFARARPAALNR